MSVTGWLLSSEAAVLFGLILGIAGLLVNIYFKRREDQRQEREHQARMAELRK
jgi:preprotein translocase subunit YajC